MKLHVKKFSFCSITWKVCPSKIGFSGNGEKTEFPGDENSSFSLEFSSQKPKEAIHSMSVLMNIHSLYNLIQAKLVFLINFNPDNMKISTIY